MDNEDLRDLEKEIKAISLSLARIEERQQVILNNYVSHKEFEPIQKLVYGLVGTVLSMIVAGGVALVIQIG